MDSSLIITQFEKLKLHGMAEAAREILMMPIQMRPCLELAFEKILEAEARHRDDARTARLLKGARLSCKPLIEDVTCSVSRNLTRDTLESVAGCGFVEMTASNPCPFRSLYACSVG